MTTRRAPGPLDGRNMRGRYRLILGHDASCVDFGSVTESLSPKTAKHRRRCLRMTFPAFAAVVKIAQFEKLNL
jgi:hypothetical protein